MLLDDPEQILGVKNAQLIKEGSSLNRQHKNKIQLDDEFNLLDNRERDFCKEAGISCKDFYKVKQVLLREQAKNSAIAHEVLLERGRDVAEVKQHADVIFDFIVKDNTQY